MQIHFKNLDKSLIMQTIFYPFRACARGRPAAGRFPRLGVGAGMHGEFSGVMFDLIDE